jgi:hypothetical protein
MIMKKTILALVCASALVFTGCLGSFQAFNNLKDWNHEVSDSRFVNNLVFWGLNIVPVYGLFFLGDALIFNVIEFWSGSNPIALEPGETETEIVERDGNTYKMVATTNRIQIHVLDGPKEGNKLELFYKPDEKSWNAIKPDGQIIKLSAFEEGFYLVYLPEGDPVKIHPGTTREQGLAKIQSHSDAYYLKTMLAKAE